MIEIRPESPADYSAIHDLTATAFESSAEASLIDALREQATSIISLVAERDSLILGHILFSPVSVVGQPEFSLMGLAPMAVLPDVQRQGIGSELVKAGLEACRGLKADGVVVLGHPEFYPRFGFVPASRFDLSCEYDVPDEVFMAVELRSGALTELSGVVNYHPAFADL